MHVRTGWRSLRPTSILAAVLLAATAMTGAALPARAAAVDTDFSNHLPVVGYVKVNATWSHPAGQPYGHTTGDNGTGSPAPAIDFSQADGAAGNTPVVSAGNGVVVGVGYQYPGAGHWISVYHAGDNRTSSYLHLAAKPLAVVGQRVGVGERLGTIGGSGGVAVHLHYQEKAGSIGSTPTRDRRLDPGLLIGCSNSTNEYRGWSGRFNFHVANYFRICSGSTYSQFSSTASSSLTVDSARNLNLRVCSANLPGQRVSVRTTRAGRDFGTRTLTASGTCLSFTDLDGAGATLSGTTYYTKVAMNQAPNIAWNSSCAALTKMHGLCDARTAP